MPNFRIGLNALNRLLRKVNLRLETLTAERLEQRRLRAVAESGGFEQPRYPVLPAFAGASYQFLLDELPKHRDRFKTFLRAGDNEVGFEFDNGFYSSPDAEILYAMVRHCRPRRIMEIGCGNSTKVIRQAIKDAALTCEHVAVDPQPRTEISRLVDVMIRQPVEYADVGARVASLAADDILFIDTSHEVKPANDVAYIYGQLLNRVRPGVVVHIHDIFLPYEYPRTWVMDLGLSWGEQYIVHALLMNSTDWDVLWPGYYLQRTLTGFAEHFPHLRGGLAQSLWLRKR